MNHKRKKLKNRRLIGIAVIVVAIIIILIHQIIPAKNINIFEGFFKDCFVTIQRIIYRPIKNFSTMTSDLETLRNVQKENKILKSNIEKIE